MRIERELQSVLNFTANTTFCLILNSYVLFKLIDLELGIEIGIANTAFKGQI